MTAALDDVAQTRRTAPRFASRTCPECMAAFTPVEARQLFCNPAHRRAWNNRATVRGAVLMPLAIVARLTRNGTRGDAATGRRAARDHNALVQRYRDEDAAAGRMPWADYLRRRYAIGFDPL